MMAQTKATKAKLNEEGRTLGVISSTSTEIQPEVLYNLVDFLVYQEKIKLAHLSKVQHLK